MRGQWSPSPKGVGVGDTVLHHPLAPAGPAQPGTGAGQPDLGGAELGTLFCTGRIGDSRIGDSVFFGMDSLALWSEPGRAVARPLPVRSRLRLDSDLACRTPGTLCEDRASLRRGPEQDLGASPDVNIAVEDRSGSTSESGQAARDLVQRGEDALSSTGRDVEGDFERKWSRNETARAEPQDAHGGSVALVWGNRGLDRAGRSVRKGEGRLKINRFVDKGAVDDGKDHLHHFPRTGFALREDRCPCRRQETWP